MTQKPDAIGESFLRERFDSLDERARKVTRHILERKHISRNTERDFHAKTTLGQRAADAVARFGGSWKFFGIFAAVLIIWVGLNSFILAGQGDVFDPYPYILPNLLLSMLAAIQAPIILMSRNRQAEKDRLNAEHDYEFNLKAELEIMLLQEMVGLLRGSQWGELLDIQRQQLELLANLISNKLDRE